MRQTPVNDYLEEISTELPEKLYGNLSDAIFETVCDFDEEVAQLKGENAKLRKYVGWLEKWALDHASFGLSADVQFELDMARRELGVEVTS